MDDVEEERLPHVVLAGAPEDSDVRRSNVLCSKIIRDRSNRNVRFRRSALFMKIVHYNQPELTVPNDEGVYRRPLKSPFPCYNCHRTFTCPPKFMPIVMLDGSRTEDGNYCSGPCMLAYAHANLNDSNLAGLAADIFVYMQDVHGFRGSSVGLAPSFRQRQAYGGELTDEQFDVIVGNPCLTTHIRMKPFIPTDVVIEWQFAGAATDAGAVGTDAADDPTAATVLSTVIDTTTPEVDHHHRWEVRGLRQPPLEAIEARLAGLPVLEKRKGLYEVYLDRRGGFDNDINADDEGDGHGVAASAAAATATATPNGTGGANTARGSKTKKRSHVAISATPQVEETPAIGPAGVTGSLTSLLTPAASSAKRRTVRVSS